MRVASLASSTESPAWNDLPDAEFLQSLTWRRRLPSELTSAARDGDVAAFCRVLRSWRYGCRKSTFKRPFGHLFCWSPPQAVDSECRLGRLVQILSSGSAGKGEQGRRHRSRRGKQALLRFTRERKRNGTAGDRLRDWLEELRLEPRLQLAEQSLLYKLLVQVTSGLPDDLLWSLWRTLLTAARELAGTDRDRATRTSPAPLAPEAAAPRPEPLAPPVFPDPAAPLQEPSQAEVAWQAALVFRGLADVLPVRKFARHALRGELLERTVADGTLRAEAAVRLEAWLPTLIRARRWAECFDVRLWNRTCDERLAGAVRCAASLLDATGRPAFGQIGSRDWPKLLDAAARLTSLPKNKPPRRFLRALSESRRSSRSGSGLKWKSSRSPAVQSDEAELAVLRSRWSVDADALVVAHHQDLPWIDLSALGRPLFRGVWEVEVASDGWPLRFPANWSCVCWHSDADADYLELQVTFDGNVRVERQVLLSRTEHLLFLADTVFDPAGSALEYRSRLPLVAGTSVAADVRTREVRLSGPWLTARVFPLALEQDRVLNSPGRMAGAATATMPGSGARGEALELEQRGTGGVYAPLVIDWHPARRKAPADWRTLTVAEHRRVVGRHAAAAHRLRIGDRQWLFYHALVRSEEPRTVLGLHTFRESVIGRVTRAGDIEPMVLVEAPSAHSETGR